ncbi:hypothetical protein [Paenibacillus ihbetae]|uniref:hypothetical protein n=1 Tax=Paenibacillus ihbetae TaxID=1870820 RepID=UPI001390253F|nr:hypothetical protein [Paenibacillus ihbetae]
MAEREMSFQPLLGMGGPSPSLLNSEKLELIIPDEIFRIQRRALRFPNATPSCVKGSHLQSPSPFPWKQMLPKKGPLPVNRSGPWRRGMWVAEREMSFQPLLGMGCPSPSLLNSEKLELIIPDEIFRIQRRALRFPNAPQATYEGFPLSAKSIPISVEADAAEEGAAPRESERAVEAGDVGDEVRSWSNGVSAACLGRPFPRGMGVSRRQVC